MSFAKEGDKTGEKSTQDSVYAKEKGSKGAQIQIDNQTPPSLVALGGYKPLPGVLRLVIVVDLEDDLREYAQVPFPETYEEAQKAAIDTLGEHMTNPKPANIQLKGISRGRDGQWISNFIRPQDWSVIVAASYCEILVIDKTPDRQTNADQAMEEEDEDFLHGHLWITAGRKTDGSMEWTKVQRQVYANTRQGNEGRPVTPWVNRPTSYQDALKIVLEVMKAQWDIRKKLEHSAGTTVSFSGSNNPPTLPQPQETNKFPVKFFTFPPRNDDYTSQWKPFPEAAYRDKKVWKRVVPAPGEILGVAVHI
ncbi:hypothetical protein EST38_g2885 [Candolleomyces aberdarensis]|uniref:Uncharacterized protein n=1 Tax=Candolleomyces aberdarensis TaxID=2316362 RepID=A0A4Q2DTM2_9AGAR|nr:hypothetical protein EST38_g2885 [Candolleomyces aberdarensis]